MISLFDTATRQLAPLQLRNEGEFTLYVCGPTVYDAPHIGHGRSVLTYDTLRRYLQWCGLKVIHVSNVTDIEDKIIARAKEENRSEADVTKQYEAVWWDAMDRLGALRPHHTPHATEYIDGMVELIGDLVEKDFAYETTDGVYFDTAKLDSYGLLAGQNLDDLQAGARVEVVEEKRTPLDFVLWRKVEATDQLVWDSPWGKGRPGWHTECVVMSLDLLGDGFDVHSGGLDLKFPHHENERAQAVALNYRFSHYWMHHGFVETGGEKMSKSLNNFTTLVDLLDRTDPRAYRLLCLQAHYRAPIEVTTETIAAAEAGISRLDEFARRTQDLEGVPIESVVDEFKKHMENDLDTPNAMAVVFDFVKRANVAVEERDSKSAAEYSATVRHLLNAVGLELRVSKAEIDDESAELVRARDQARSEKDFAQADMLRSQLEKSGWIVEDKPDGTHIHK